MTLRDLARKDVIRLSNGENLGRIDDIEPGCRPASPPIKSYNLCKTCEIQVQLSVQYAIINRTTVPWGKMYAKTAA